MVQKGCRFVPYVSYVPHKEQWDWLIGYYYAHIEGLGNNMNLIARLYLVEAIDRLVAADAAEEDGNRFRLDFNFKF